MATFVKLAPLAQTSSYATGEGGELDEGGP